MQCLSSPGGPLGDPSTTLPEPAVDWSLFAEPHPTHQGPQPRSLTPWGVKSSQGERQSMEDAWSQAAVNTTHLGGCSPQGTAASSPTASQDGELPNYMGEDLTLFAVYDGHGGREVAQHAADNLHRHFGRHLAQQQAGLRPELGEEAQATVSDRPAQSPPSTTAVSEALRQAFLQTDKDLAGTDAGDFVGCTAVVAVLGKDHIWVAHCGDSRAVLQKNGEAVPVTKDHKPDREDEAARVRAAGGRIVFNSGSYRVMGMLAMSRAIGDHFLRPYVIADPEVAVLERSSDDEVLIIATDGLWDVFSCKEATSLAQRCIARSKDRGMSRYGGCRVAASVLTKVAMERGSRDNITVIVIDVTPLAESPSAPEPLDLLVPSSAQNEDGSARDDVAQADSYSVGTCVFIKSKSGRSLDLAGTSSAPDPSASDASEPSASHDGEESQQRQQQRQGRQRSGSLDLGLDLDRTASGPCTERPSKYLRAGPGHRVPCRNGLSGGPHLARANSCGVVTLA